MPPTSTSVGSVPARRSRSTSSSPAPISPNKRARRNEAVSGGAQGQVGDGKSGKSKGNVDRLSDEENALKSTRRRVNDSEGFGTPAQPPPPSRTSSSRPVQRSNAKLSTTQATSRNDIPFVWRRVRGRDFRFDAIRNVPIDKEERDSIESWEAERKLKTLQENMKKAGRRMPTYKSTPKVPPNPPKVAPVLKPVSKPAKDPSLDFPTVFFTTFFEPATDSGGSKEEKRKVSVGEREEVGNDDSGSYNTSTTFDQTTPDTSIETMTTTQWRRKPPSSPHRFTGLSIVEAATLLLDSQLDVPAFHSLPSIKSYLDSSQRVLDDKALSFANYLGSLLLDVGMEKRARSVLEHAGIDVELDEEEQEEEEEKDEEEEEGEDVRSLKPSASRNKPSLYPSNATPVEAPPTPSPSTAQSKALTSNSGGSRPLLAGKTLEEAVRHTQEEIYDSNQEVLPPLSTFDDGSGVIEAKSALRVEMYLAELLASLAIAPRLRRVLEMGGVDLDSVERGGKGKGRAANA